MQITVVTNSQYGHQRQWHDAMAVGLKKHGLDVIRKKPGEDVDTDTVVCWGWRIGKPLREQGKDVLVMERGYIGNIEMRRQWASCGWNGLNGRARFPQAPDSRRWNENFMGRVRPWRYTDGYTLLIGQVPGDSSLDGTDHLKWLRKTYDAIEGDVVFRPHPNTPAAAYGSFKIVSKNSLADDLMGAKSVVTWNSNTGVDAVLNGIPAVVMDEGGMAWPVAGHELGDIEMPQRDEWISHLAYAQWTEDEVSSGEAWEHLRTVRWQ